MFLMYTTSTLTNSDASFLITIYSLEYGILKNRLDDGITYLLT